MEPAGSEIPPGFLSPQKLHNPWKFPHKQCHKALKSAPLMLLSTTQGIPALNTPSKGEELTAKITRRNRSDKGPEQVGSRAGRRNWVSPSILGGAARWTVAIPVPGKVTSSPWNHPDVVWRHPEMANPSLPRESCASVNHPHFNTRALALLAVCRASASDFSFPCRTTGPSWPDTLGKGLESFSGLVISNALLIHFFSTAQCKTLSSHCDILLIRNKQSSF